MTPNVHWIAYPVLLGGLLLGGWLWHDSQVKDAAILQTLSIAKTQAATDDKQTATANAVAQQNLQTQNAQLTTKLTRAKTLPQQVALINQESGTHLVVEAQPTTRSDTPGLPDAPQAVNPRVTLPATDVPLLAQQATDLAKAKNQIADDAIVISGLRTQVADRDKIIADQGTEVTALKGGSRIKRFLKGAEKVGIGLGIGAVVGIVADRKIP